ncbi:hypothetical protein HD554DRAFT_2036622 [Boletus coccyginus]|nr:hypothetical protein HD554DRAFT_2036622 [Boletus coccyginus]
MEGHSEDAMANIHLPKMQQTDGQHTKASDNDITHEVLMVAITMFCCLICTQAPFPQHTLAETELAKKAWTKACQATELNMQLTSSLLKMSTLTGSFEIIKQTSHVHVLSKHAIQCNWDLAEMLKDSSCFNIKIKRGIYKSNLLQLAVTSMWFTGQGDEGVIHHQYFNSIATNTIALVLTAIEYCIDEWATGIKTDVAFMATFYVEIFQSYVPSRHTFERHTLEYGLLAHIQKTLHNNTQCLAGAEPLEVEKLRSRIDNSEFDMVMHKYEMELQAGDGDDEKGSGNDSEADCENINNASEQEIVLNYVDNNYVVNAT